MGQVTLERDDKGPLIFQGERIAHVSTAQPHKNRWTELEIYRVEPSHSVARWVVYSMGKSRLEHERTLRRATVCVSPQGVAEALRDRNTGELSGPGIDVLDMAADEDDDLAEYVDHEVFEEEVL